MKKLAVPALIVCIALMAAAGCRKDDATPHYNYYGGTSPTGPSESPGEGPEFTPGSDTPDLGALAGDRDLETTPIDLTGCMLFQIPVEEGFIATADEFVTKWNEWCAGKALPDVDFETNFIAYYFINAGGCEEYEFTGASIKDGKISVEIEKTQQTGECICPMIMKYRRFLVAVERVEGDASFNVITNEIPCAQSLNP